MVILNTYHCVTQPAEPQKEDWTKGFHKKECKFLKRAPEIPSKNVRLMAKIYFKIKAGLGGEEEGLPDGTKRRYEDLDAPGLETLSDGRNLELHEQMEVLQHYLSQVQEFVAYLGLEKTEETVDFCQETWCRIIHNGEGMEDSTGMAISGSGIFLGGSFVKHSCWPNAVAVGRGNKMVVRATQSIADFSQVTISYSTQVCYSRKKRLDHLRSKYLIRCKCAECKMTNPGSEERERIRNPPFRCLKCKSHGLFDWSNQRFPDCLTCEALGIPDDGWLGCYGEAYQQKLVMEMDKVFAPALARYKKGTSTDLPKGIELWTPHVMHRFKMKVGTEMKASLLALEVMCKVDQLEMEIKKSLAQKYDQNVALDILNLAIYVDTLGWKLETERRCEKYDLAVDAEDHPRSMGLATIQMLSKQKKTDKVIEKYDLATARKAIQNTKAVDPQERIQMAEMLFQKAREMFKIIHGEDHPVYLKTTLGDWHGMVMAL